MSDIVVNQVSNLLNTKPGKIVPVYLVSLFSQDRKTIDNFLSINVEELPHGIRFAGFFVAGSSEKTRKNYEKLMQNTSKEQYRQILISWNNVYSVENLIFKQK